MADHPLAKAARELNAYAEKHGLKATIEHCDLKFEDVTYLAEQRALRALYAKTGINLNPNYSMTLQMTTQQVFDLAHLTAAYMDSLMIGWRAKEIADEEKAADRPRDTDK